MKCILSHPVLPYRIFPLGDAAITVDFGNCIDEAINREVIARFEQLSQQPLPGMIEVVPAYSSLTLFYDLVELRKKILPGLSVYDWIKKQLDNRLQQPIKNKAKNERLVRIPVCYDQEFGMDIKQLAITKNISVQEIIQIHTSKTYRVYMLGFLPGFAYMGELDERIAMPRKPQPVKVAAGSIGIAGKQTGLYPFLSPGGWQIIGRTPLKLFNGKSDNPTLLNAGDNIQFYSIAPQDFYQLQNEMAG